LTIDKGRFTVRRARLAPAMISTPGHRASRRRQRGALPAWSRDAFSAAGSEPAGDAPVHRSFESIRQRAAGLGYCRVEEVGPDSGRCVHPEKQNENRVISEPPPTPVNRTSMPTTKPDMTKSGLIVANRSMSSSARSLTVLLKWAPSSSPWRC
jgi:hypothetical protein